jgi:hypothetical protein
VSTEAAVVTVSSEGRSTAFERREAPNRLVLVFGGSQPFSWRLRECQVEDGERGLDASGEVAFREFVEASGSRLL